MVNGAELLLLTEATERDKYWVLQQLRNRGFKAEFVEREVQLPWYGKLLRIKPRKETILRIL